jgi:hypothetical protein
MKQSQSLRLLQSAARRQHRAQTARLVAHVSQSEALDP